MALASGGSCGAGSSGTQSSVAGAGCGASLTLSRSNGANGSCNMPSAMVPVLRHHAEHPRQLLRGLRLRQPVNGGCEAHGIAALLPGGKVAPAAGAQVHLAGRARLAAQAAACPLRAEALAA